MAAPVSVEGGLESSDVNSFFDTPSRSMWCLCRGFGLFEVNISCVWIKSIILFILLPTQMNFHSKNPEYPYPICRFAMYWTFTQNLFGVSSVKLLTREFVHDKDLKICTWFPGLILYVCTKIILFYIHIHTPYFPCVRLHCIKCTLN